MKRRLYASNSSDFTQGLGITCSTKGRISSGILFVGITGDKNYRQFRIDAEHIPDEVSTGYQRCGEIRDEKSDLRDIR